MLVVGSAESNSVVLVIGRLADAKASLLDGSSICSIVVPANASEPKAMNAAGNADVYFMDLNNGVGIIAAPLFPPRE